MKPVFRAIPLLLAACLFLSACGAGVPAPTATPTETAEKPLSKSGFLLNTVISVSVYGTQDAQVLEGVFDLCRTLEGELSRTIQTSDVYRLNHAQGAPTKVGPAAAHLIREGIRYGELSQGAFDITVEPLSSLWNFTAEAPRVPDESAIKSAAALVDYRNIGITEEDVVTLPPGMGIDLGAIAKGYIADRMGEYLRGQGIGRALINLGGNALVLGSRPDGSPWRAGIQKPFDERGALLGVMGLTDHSLVTSGPYERGFSQNGIWYHHLLNPQTGYPAEGPLQSVSIYSPKSIDGDALSTSCYVLGLEKGMALVESLEGIEAVFYTQDGKIHTSSGIASGQVVFEAKE